MRLSRREFERLVRQAVESLPRRFLQHMRELAVEVHPAPWPDLVRQEELEDPCELLGLYLGVPLTERSVESPWEAPPRILIFQRAIERCCQSRREILDEVRTTVLHEIAHHFGMDEADLEDLGYD